MFVASPWHSYTMGLFYECMASQSNRLVSGVICKHRFWNRLAPDAQNTITDYYLPLWRGANAKEANNHRWYLGVKCVTDLITIISEEFPRSTHYHIARERRDMFTSHHHHGRSVSMIGSKGCDKRSAWLDVKINYLFASHPVLSDRSDERYTYSWAAY